MPHPRLHELTLKLNSNKSSDRLLALVALRNLPTSEAFPLIKPMLFDDYLPVRSMAIRSLASHPSAESISLLVQMLDDPNYEIRAGAAGALGVVGDHNTVQALSRAFLEDTEWLVRFSAAVSLGNLQNPRADEVLLQALEQPELIVQQAAIAALGEIKAFEALDTLLRFVQSEDWLVRKYLATALGNLPCSKSISALKYLAKDDHPQVAAAATIALEQIDEP
ncbi:HEAT repeat domain-containing protein [Acaryochloris sp. IP29b_bin.137]|uniref:HEAT repeat domain-containing protein n=1 Tax=Acaryochloris sp. IP29b_bin.137 TaxID=2969217 RepID=UPI002602CAA7|nr:HEAT repeat domain-containing protein [Acaryochloris sp. IP29b_bin.137]